MESQEYSPSSDGASVQLDTQRTLDSLWLKERDLTLLLSLAYEGLNLPERTPERVARWLIECYRPLPKISDVLGRLFDEPYDEIVLVKDIEVKAICEHHLLPFTGYAAIGYLPQGQVVGLSKLVRLVNWATARPTLQERVTTQIANNLMDYVRPQGVMTVLYNCEHSCMSVRGVEDSHVNTTTSAVRGVFKENQVVRNEFLSLLSK